MTGVEPRSSGMQVTALPTEPQPLPKHATSLKLLNLSDANPLLSSLGCVVVAYLISRMVASYTIGTQFIINFRIIIDATTWQHEDQ